MRMPPNFRRPDTCEKCRFCLGSSVCDLYKYNIKHPDNYVCDDFREDNEE